MRAAWTAAEVMNRFRDHVGSVKLIAGDSGAFEVQLDGKQIYSKWDTGRYPELKELTDPVEAKIQAKVADSCGAGDGSDHC